MNLNFEFLKEKMALVNFGGLTEKVKEWR